MNTRKQASIKLSNLNNSSLIYGYDGWLVTTSIFLLCFGLIMVASSSIAIAERQFDDSLYYFWRQCLAVFIGITAGLVVLKLPMKFWQVFSVVFLVMGIALLIFILLPGVGKEVNGSVRWIQLGPFTLQASEPVKISVLTYMAGYLVRQREQVCNNFTGFIIPIGVVTLVSGLLLLEPDFGACVVLFMTTLGMLFLAGVPIARFVSWALVAICSLVTLAVIYPYRLQRLTSFLDPWSDPYNSGFQLTQALIAFGRGDWFGVGLGGSVQKLFYLPEAHTDFVLAVVAEELGLVAIILLIFIYAYIIARAFIIGQAALNNNQPFSAYFAYGIGLIIGIQSFINIGVNMGILPTKGLTLPLMSYGSNSVVISCILLAVLLRIEYENRQYEGKQVPNAVTHYVA